MRFASYIIQSLHYKMAFGPAINLFFDNFLYIDNQQSKKKINLM